MEWTAFPKLLYDPKQTVEHIITNWTLVLKS